MVSKGDTLGNGDTQALVQAQKGVVLRRLIGAPGNTSDVVDEVIDGSGNRQYSLNLNGSITVTNIYATHSATATAVTTGGTITPTNSVMRLTAAAAATGVILAPGSASGQQLTLINESATNNAIQFAAAGTSNVAGGTANTLFGGTAIDLVWDTSTQLWYVIGATFPDYYVESMAPATGAATSLSTGGTITPTAGVMRVTTAGAVTGIIMAAGTDNGQTVTVMNESANTITFAAVGTSNVADGVTTAIPASTARMFIWSANASTPAWYRVSG